MALMTNQVFHGGLWGTLHNKSVKPKIEITEGVIDKNTLSFDIYRTEGVMFMALGSFVLTCMIKEII
ncbi:TQO small subunit DoxA [Saccharicrinis fermentans DSM 9555 = JCM 21142]|uniref:TQO small subunit DoxA n=1 Tax=Saccharicrinis fermentans DSM 9555 = JCM 21142 TaxID=869213 RepID=W7YEY5_9BACT|nr:TQO small subunit DoxA [Saccharicrinis fermentans DSM 9555 = JCM 21142]